MNRFLFDVTLAGGILLGSKLVKAVTNNIAELRIKREDYLRKEEQMKICTEELLLDVETYNNFILGLPTCSLAYCFTNADLRQFELKEILDNRKDFEEYEKRITKIIDDGMKTLKHGPNKNHKALYNESWSIASRLLNHIDICEKDFKGYDWKKFIEA